jgi:hypothetical protein
MIDNELSLYKYSIKWLIVSTIDVSYYVGGIMLLFWLSRMLAQAVY